ncbi:hypothetical protein C8Q74DRAFT_1264921 [Fomes fomentarius]|nr:hypothetical protein C8Q74DRAFT_1264921 [Fomes fomentarius]
MPYKLSLATVLATREGDRPAVRRRLSLAERKREDSRRCRARASATVTSDDQAGPEREGIECQRLERTRGEPLAQGRWGRMILPLSSRVRVADTGRPGDPNTPSPRLRPQSRACL